MPIYRYRCEACGHIDEVLAKISDPPPEACSVCGEGPMVKAVSRTSFKLKGGGWYAEGYGASGGKSSSASSSSGSSASGSSASSGSDSASTSSSSSSSSSED